MEKENAPAVALLGSVVTFLLGTGVTLGVTYLAWNHLPVVGGEWWFYIRVVATFIVFAITAKIALVLGMIFLSALFVFLTPAE